ncbi:MAG: YfiR/HmsC family protein [bacterium]|nr:YfiR/HmsC family protein [bacterium]
MGNSHISSFKALLCVCALLLSKLVLAQSAERYKIEVAYVYSFAKNIDWPKSDNKFKILLMSEDRSLINEFNLLGETRSLRNQPIQVTSTSSSVVPDGFDLVYISQPYNQATRSVFDQLRGSNTLIVTDGYDDERFIMINFIEEADQTLGFQINQANIINQGLEVLPDMVLLGGTKVDVAKLYKGAQDSVRVMESRLSGLESRYDSILSSISESNKIITEQREMIAVQTNQIEDKQDVIEKQSSSLDSLQFAVAGSAGELDSIVLVLNNKESQLNELQDGILRQSAQMEAGNKMLEEQKKKLAEQEEAIRSGASELEQMTSVVDAQKNTVYILIFSVVGVLIFSFLIYRAYKARRRDAKKLQEQKDELSEILAELKEAQTQLVQSEKMASLGVLTAGIAHEINNAINFVYSGIHVLETRIQDIKPVIDKVKHLSMDQSDVDKVLQEIIEEKENADYNQAHEVIDQMVKSIQIGAKRTTDIVAGLRSFSRMEEEEKALIDIHQDLEVALLLLQNKYKNTVTIEKKFDESLPKINAYQGQLGQAFLNIISNAIDAVESVDRPGEISIETSLEGDQVKILIRDNGSGISQDKIDKIFDPFFTTKKVGSGTGLGLSITYGIIEKHGGSLNVSSEKNSWSVFTILLPLK